MKETLTHLAALKPFHYIDYTKLPWSFTKEIRLSCCFKRVRILAEAAAGRYKVVIVYKGKQICRK